MYRPILRFPDPRLHAISRPVGRVTPAVAAIMDDLVETLLAEDGASISAVQVGIPLRLIVLRDPGDGSILQVADPICRPSELARPSRIWEGCLSFPAGPDAYAQVEARRQTSVVLEGLGRDGEPLPGEAVSARVAGALQHEMDHLDGVLMTERLGRLVRERIEKRARRWGPKIQAAAAMRARASLRVRINARSDTDSTGRS